MLENFLGFILFYLFMLSLIIFQFVILNNLLRFLDNEV